MRRPNLNIPLGVPATLLAWFLLTRAGFINPLFLPSPENVFRALMRQLITQSLWRDVLTTSVRAGTGLVLSAALGIPVGLLLGRSRRTYRHVSFLLDFVRSI